MVCLGVMAENSTDGCKEEARTVIDELIAFSDSAKTEFDSLIDLHNSRLNYFSSFSSCRNSLSRCAAESCLSIFFRFSSISFGI